MQRLWSVLPVFVVVALRQAERRQASELSNHRRELEDMTSHSQERIQSLESGLAKVQIERNLLNSNLSANAVFKNRWVITSTT